MVVGGTVEAGVCDKLLAHISGSEGREMRVYSYFCFMVIKMDIIQRMRTKTNNICQTPHFITEATKIWGAVGKFGFVVSTGLELPILPPLPP